MHKPILAAFAIGCLASASPAQSNSLTLVCQGINNSSSTVGATANNMPITVPTSEASVVLFKMDGSSASLKVPPNIATIKKNGGWLPVSGLEIADTYIKGRVSFSIVTKPRFEIDRNTGLMNFYSNNIGFGSTFSFTGSCQPYQETDRKF